MDNITWWTEKDLGMGSVVIGLKRGKSQRDRAEMRNGRSV